MRKFVSVFLLGALVAACSESTTNNTGGDGGAGGGGDGGTSTTKTGGSGGAKGSTSDGGSTGMGGNTGSGGAEGVPVVINEIKATEFDWVELYNTSSSAFDLSNYAVADSMDDGTPKLEEAARFPAGTMIAAGEHLVLVEGDAAEGVGPHDMCLPMGGPSSCYYFTYGISDGNGDKIFLLSPDDAIVTEAAYPMNGAPAGQSYGRFPDGTGDFIATEPTPGEANKMP